MKYLLLCVFITTVAHADELKDHQYAKPVYCYTTQEFFTMLKKSDYREQAVWIGNAGVSKYSLFTNEKTGTWTIVQFDKEDACMIGAGEGSKNIYPNAI